MGEVKWTLGCEVHGAVPNCVSPRPYHELDIENARAAEDEDVDEDDRDQHGLGLEELLGLEGTDDADTPLQSDDHCEDVGRAGEAPINPDDRVQALDLPVSAHVRRDKRQDAEGLVGEQ